MDTSSLTVTFKGICTHIPADAIRTFGGSVPDDVKHRVVLVTGVNGLFHRTPKDQVKHIPPHDASLNLGTNAVAGTTGMLHGLRQVTPSAYLLRGVRLSVANAKAPQQLSADLANVPSLHFYAADTDAPEPQLQLDLDVVAGQSAAAYFDIDCGTLTVHDIHPDTPDKVVYVKYVVETDGPPQLRVETFYDGTTGTIVFAQNDASISLYNTGESKETWWDFMLHYLVCTEVPPSAFPPGPPSDEEVDSLTSGCSNSNWP